MYRVSPLLLLLVLFLPAPHAARPAGAASGSLPAVFVAQELLTAVVAVKRWAQLLYRIQPPSPAHCPPSEKGPFTNSDGSTTITYVGEDCVRTVLTVFPDSSYRAQIRYPDGLRENLAARAGDFLPPPVSRAQTYEITHRFSNGNRAHYALERELQPLFGTVVAVVAEHYHGRFAFNDRPITFRLDRTYAGVLKPDELEFTLPGGVRATLEVPFNVLTLEPDFTQPVSGTLALRQKTLAFQIAADRPEEKRWSHLTVLPGSAGPYKDLHGEFTLNPDFSGRGQMYRGSKLFFVAAWDENAQANIVLPSGQTTSAGPARGALDLLALRWSGLASANGPQPGL